MALHPFEKDDQVTHIALFHSVYGQRPAVLAAAERLRAAGHKVVTPDLYAGQAAATVDEGFALSDRIGWAAIMQRARDAARDLPDDAVLAGFSMGARVAVATQHGTGPQIPSCEVSANFTSYCWES